MQTWADSRLERAHLVPHSLHGPTTPANMVLLCAPCHAAAPDWIDPNEMLAWVRRRENWVSRWAKDFRSAWDEVRPGQPLPNLNADGLPDLLFAELEAKSATHGSKLALTTAALALAAIAER